MATLSLWAAYQWNKHLFDGVVLPSELDKDIFVNNLIMESAELEVLYTDFDFLQQAITYWSASRLATWEKLQRVLYAEYDPLINVSTDEVRDITQDRDLTTKNDGSNTLNTAAWNDSDVVEREEQVVDNTTKNTGQVTTSEHYHMEGDGPRETKQDTMVKEIRMRLEYDMYRIIIQDFKRRFCLLVY